jgi:L-asparaginase
MVQDPETGALNPFDFEHLIDQVPELKKFKVQLKVQSFNPPIDSSNMSPKIWLELSQIIFENYSSFDGFVILHGSDTMAYTASALSFMLQNLSKPVVLTGSQLPIGVIRTDGKENLITAIEIAAAKQRGKAIVPEVCIYFEYKLFRGNRTLKYNSEHFDAFRSPNYPHLCEAGINLNFNTQCIRALPSKPLKLNKALENSVVVLTIFPGINSSVVKSILSIKGLKGVIIETFGAGNAPTDATFLNELLKAINKGIIIASITQCMKGKVMPGLYETSRRLQEIGVLNGADLTKEAAIAKLMHLLGNYTDKKIIKQLFETSLAGEM